MPPRKYATDAEHCAARASGERLKGQMKLQNKNRQDWKNSGNVNRESEKLKP